jgi:hypothetical protein
MGGRGSSSGNKPQPMGMGIGLDSRITEDGESLPSSAIPNRQQMSAAEVREAEAKAERQMNAKLDALRERDAAAERAATAARNAAEQERARGFQAGYAGRLNPVDANKKPASAPPKAIETQAQFNARQAQQRANDAAFEQRSRARIAAAREAQAARVAKPTSVVSLPEIREMPKPAVKPGLLSRLFRRGKK